MESERIREGVKLMQQGDKASTKGLFRKPDWDIAAGSYERAATAFKIGRSYDQAVQAYTKTSEAYFKIDAIHLSGKALESAALILAQNMNQPQRAAEVYKQASDLFMADGKMDRAAEQLEKAARAMENIDVNTAIDLYSSACALYEQEDRGRFAIEIFKKGITLSVRSKKYAKAVELLHRQSAILQKLTSRTHQYKANLSLLIILFAMGDEVEADKQFNNMCGSDPGFMQSEEADICQHLLQAYDEADQQLLEKTVRRQQVSFLDNEIAKLSRTLTVPGESLSTQPASNYPPRQPYAAYPPQPSSDLYNNNNNNRSNYQQSSSSPAPPPPGYDGPSEYPPEKQQPYHPPGYDGPTDYPPEKQYPPPPTNTYPSYQQPTQTQPSQARPPPTYHPDDDDDDDLR